MQKFATRILLTFSVHVSVAQTTTADSIINSGEAWNLSLSGYYYLIPHNDVFMFSGYADHKSLHFETRYNYEDENTISAFAGWIFEGGRNLKFNITPMVGILAGQTNGLAPALETEVSYKLFDFYSESEYVFNMKKTDTKENDVSYFYTWWQLAVTPAKNVRTGISGQRINLTAFNSNVQRGIFAEYSFWKCTTGLYYFRNPASGDGFFITSLTIDLK